MGAILTTIIVSLGIVYLAGLLLRALLPYDPKGLEGLKGAEPRRGQNGPD